MAGDSPTPLIKKLGLKPGHNIRLVNAPENYFKLLGVSPLQSGTKGKFDFIHYFVKSIDEMEKVLPELKNQLKQNGMIWISWTKKSWKIPTDVTETAVRTFAIQNGLVDIKVCAIDDQWSGLKFVIPIRDRK